MPLAGRPMMLALAERTAQARRVDDVIIATSVDEADDPIVETCLANGVSVFRGDPDDVLSRVHDAAEHFEVDLIVELMGDSPLVHGDLIDATVEMYLEGEYDYVCSYTTTVRPDGDGAPTFPGGAWSQVFSREALRIAHREARDEFYREHSSSYFFKNPDRWRLGYLYAEGPWSPLNRPDHFFAVNLEEQYDFVREVFARSERRAGKNFDLFTAIEVADSIHDDRSTNAHT